MKIYQILFGMLVGILLCLIWLKEPEVIPDPDLVQVKRQYLESMFGKFHSKVVRLQHMNDSLSDVLAENKSIIDARKSKFSQSKNKLIKKVERLNGDSISKGDIDSLKASSHEVFSDIDSLHIAFENRILLLENLVALRDSEINIYKNSFNELNDLLSQQLLREQQLTLELNTAYKVQKKKVREHKLLSGGMLVLSGIATTIYINSRK